MKRIIAGTLAAVAIGAGITAAALPANASAPHATTPDPYVVYRVAAFPCPNVDANLEWREFRSLTLASRQELAFVHDQDAAPGTIRRVDLTLAHVADPIHVHIISKSVQRCTD